MRRMAALSALAASWIVLICAPADAGDWRHGYWHRGYWHPWGWDYRNWGYGSGYWGFGIAAASPWWGYDGYQPVYGYAYPNGYSYSFADYYHPCTPASGCNSPLGQRPYGY